MATIVLDLSAQGCITIRPRNRSDELTDSPQVSTYWLRTPYGNAVYAFGPEGLGALLAMASHMEFELFLELRHLLHTLFEQNLSGLSINIWHDEKLGEMSVAVETESPVSFTSKAEFLDEVARISGPRPGP